jgi:signal transduction histidine kinase
MPTTLSSRRPNAWLARHLALGLVALLWSCAVLGAPSRIVEQAFVADPGGQMTLEQAMQQPEEIYAGALVRLRVHSVVWVRLRLAPASEPGAAAPNPVPLPATELLRTIPLWSQSMSLFDPLQTDADGRAGGLGIQPDDAPFTVHTLTIPVGSEPRDLWLRLQPSGPIYLNVTVLTTEAAAEREVVDAMRQGVVIGLYAMLILLGLLAWVVDRKGIGHAMFAKQVFNLLLAMLNANLLQIPDLPASWPEGSSTYAMECLRLLNMGVSLWFFIRVLELLHAPRWALQLLRLPLAVMACGTGLMMTGHLTLVRTLDIGLYIAVPLCLLLAGLACVREPLLSRTTVGLAQRGAERLALGLLLFLAWIPSLPSGFFKTQEQSFFALFTPFATLSAVGVLVLVGWRRIRADRQRQVEQVHRAELNALALDFERGERQRQQEFMAMLTHELKAPLSTLGMVVGSATPSASMRRHAELALASMRQVIDHCAQSADIDDASTPTQQVPCSLAVALELRCDALAEKARVVVAPTAAMPQLLADPRMLAIIFNNLLDNALKYSPPGSPISVTLVRSVNPEGAVQEVQVRNQASPGPLPDALRLFQKYYRSEAAQRISGSGLGLHLSRLLARRQGGDLQYRADACNLTFTLVLPEQRPVAVLL